jgi:hypothetical protein
VTPRLVGLNGFKRSGKDTTHKLLAEIMQPRGQEVVRRAFADNVKLLAASCLGLLDDLDTATAVELCDYLKCDGNTIETVFRHIEGPPTSVEITGREFQQNIGKRVRDILGDTLWIDRVLPTDYHSGPSNLRAAWPKWWDNFVLPETGVSANFQGGNVADWCCITDVRYPNEAERVLALGGEVWEIVRPGLASDGHETEQPLPRELVTVTINNDADIDNLRAAVQQVAQGYGHRNALPHP